MRKYVVKFCDSQFTNEDFTDTGNAFVEHYYIKQYFGDYGKAFESAKSSVLKNDTFASIVVVVPPAPSLAQIAVSLACSDNQTREWFT